MTINKKALKAIGIASLAIVPSAIITPVIATSCSLSTSQPSGPSDGNETNVTLNPLFSIIKKGLLPTLQTDNQVIYTQGFSNNEAAFADKTSATNYIISALQSTYKILFGEQAGTMVNISPSNASNLEIDVKFILNQDNDLLSTALFGKSYNQLTSYVFQKCGVGSITTSSISTIELSINLRQAKISTVYDSKKCILFTPTLSAGIIFENGRTHSEESSLYVNKKIAFNFDSSISLQNGSIQNLPTAFNFTTEIVNKVISLVYENYFGAFNYNDFILARNSDYSSISTYNDSINILNTYFQSIGAPITVTSISCNPYFSDTDSKIHSGFNIDFTSTSPIILSDNLLNIDYWSSNNNFFLDNEKVIMENPINGINVEFVEFSNEFLQNVLNLATSYTNTITSRRGSHDSFFTIIKNAINTEIMPNFFNGRYQVLEFNIWGNTNGYYYDQENNWVYGTFNMSLGEVTNNDVYIKYILPDDVSPNVYFSSYMGVPYLILNLTTSINPPLIFTDNLYRLEQLNQYLTEICSRLTNKDSGTAIVSPNKDLLLPAIQEVCSNVVNIDGNVWGGWKPEYVQDGIQGVKLAIALKQAFPGAPLYVQLPANDYFEIGNIGSTQYLVPKNPYPTQIRAQ